MRTEIGVRVVGLGWMGQVHSRGYRRLLDHYPDCPLEPRLVKAADAVEARLWVESLLNGTPGGPDAWDGYASLVVAEACIASLRSGSPERVVGLDRPALYGGQDPGATR